MTWPFNPAELTFLITSIPVIILLVAAFRAGDNPQKENDDE